MRCGSRIAPTIVGDAEPDLGIGKGGGRGGDDEVAEQNAGQAVAHARAVHRGDGGFEEFRPIRSC